jgi:hypothetical protein
VNFIKFINKCTSSLTLPWNHIRKFAWIQNIVQLVLHLLASLILPFTLSWVLPVLAVTVTVTGIFSHFFDTSRLQPLHVHGLCWHKHISFQSKLYHLIPGFSLFKFSFFTVSQSEVFIPNVLPDIYSDASYCVFGFWNNCQNLALH